MAPMKPAAWPCSYQPMRCPSQVAKIEPTIPSRVVTMNPPGPPTKNLAIAPARNPIMMIQSQCSMSAPYFARGLDDETQLGDLFVPGQRVAVDGRREAALRAEAELLQRYVFCRLVDPALQLVLAFERGALASDEAEDHPFVPARHEAQWLEPTRAGVVVFQEEAVDSELAEQGLGDMVVAALGHPGRAEIAAAHMGAHGHARRLAGERGVDQADVGQMLLLAVAADARHIGALGRVVEIGEAGVVELQIGAAECGKTGDLLPVDPGEVVPEGVHLGIGGLVDH